ncbi:uncharacterized protein LOC133178397 isoform X2 [Saccostrea echinata]|uniref:uncharacterized protein LOC133178397 isoform X2 n=1 Tax=Saccostrea echinata TaxID=191078 RepID=UPI002A835592|nr:uncharacterized protein LOC133178397 isoform X2 [Saccostrea echinata]
MFMMESIKAVVIKYSTFSLSENWKFIREKLAKPTSAPDSFLNQLKEFQADKCDPSSARKVKALLSVVTVDSAKQVSLAASYLATWAINAVEDCKAAGKLQGPAS